jgi:hypothetical protein
METFGTLGTFIPIVVDATGSASVDITSSPFSGGEASSSLEVDEAFFGGNNVVFDQALTDASTTDATGDQSQGFSDTGTYLFKAQDFYVISESVSVDGALASFDASLDPTFTLAPGYTGDGSFILTPGIGDTPPEGHGSSVPDAGSTSAMVGGALLCLAILTRRRSFGTMNS